MQGIFYMKIKPLVNDFLKPEYKTDSSAGMDIYLQSKIVLKPEQDNTINLGFSAEVPEGYVALLVPRSSTGIKGINLRNTIGVIDSDYRGEWIAHIILDNISTQEGYVKSKFTFERGERLIQCLIVPIYKANIEITDTLSDTARGTGGFGSTN